MPRELLLFDFGSAVSAVGVIIAAYQLRTKELKIYTWLYPRYFEYIWLLLGLLGILLSLISVFISSNESLSFWFQLISGCCFISSPIVFLLPLFVQPQYSISNSDNFANVLFICSTSNDQEVYKYSVNLLVKNLDAIFKTINYTRIKTYCIAYSCIDTQETSFSKDIFQVILTEPKFVNYIVESRLDFLEAFFRNISTCLVKQVLEFGLIHDHLMSSLFLNQNSFMYKHKIYGGESLVRNIFETLYSDINVIENFVPFPTSIYLGKKYESTDLKELLKVTIKALKISSETILGNSKAFYSRALYSGFCFLNDVVREIIYAKSFEPIDKLLVLKEASRFYGNEFLWIYKKSIDKRRKELKKELGGEIEESLKSNDDDVMMFIPNLYCSSYMDFLELILLDSGLSSKLNEFIIGTELLYVDCSERSNQFAYLRTTMQEKIWHQIKTHDIHGLYPPIIKIYSLLFAWLPESDYPDWYLFEYNKLIEFLYGEIRPKLLVEKKMADGKSMEKAILPFNIKFYKDRQYSKDGSRGAFYSIGKLDYGNREEIELKPRELSHR
jgi:hypothetical protein